MWWDLNLKNFDEIVHEGCLLVRGVNFPWIFFMNLLGFLMIICVHLGFCFKWLFLCAINIPSIEWTSFWSSLLLNLENSLVILRFGLSTWLFKDGKCPNPSLGFTTKAKGLQGCGPRRSRGVTPHVPRSVGRCEGVNPHTPKATPTWEMESRWISESSEGDFMGQTQWLEMFLISLKSSWNIHV